MQLLVPTRSQIHIAFDSLLNVLYPQLFPMKIEVDSAELTEQWSLVHEMIDKHLPIEPINAIESIQNHVIYVRIRVFLADFEKEEYIDIPCRFKSLKEKIIINEPITIAQLVPFVQIPPLQFSPEQLMKIIELHLAVDRLMVEFDRELKHGRLFFQSAQSLELLITYLPKCTYNQGMRFFYWGILKFCWDRDLDIWLNEEQFREFLSKLND